MKKTKLTTAIILILTVVFGTRTGLVISDKKVAEASGTNIQSEFRGLSFTPWDIEGASKYAGSQEVKPYTIMIYMNGSDLESENGAATDDLIEMLDSGLNSENANIVLLTGGTNRWQNNVVPSNECVLWEIADGGIYEICGIGLVNMGDPGTLASFIEFSTVNYPADKYGLIMWDHGGGSIAGYGHDEKFNNSTLTLREMKYAFAKSVSPENKLEFLGFDSCLMAAVEMAVTASDYAHFLVASEDLEPGDGWDYSFLAALNDNPDMNGDELGIVITDYFMEYYGEESEEMLTLSVIDLAGAQRVMDAMGELMSLCSVSLLEERPVSFASLAVKRGRTKTFGMGSPRDSECDMVDIGDMAEKLSDLYPYEADNIFDALAESVVYNRHNSDIDLYGLSAYYIYGAKDGGDMALNTYSSLSLDEDYTQYQYNFFSLLNTANRAGRRSAVSANISGYPLEYSDEIIRSELTIWQPIEAGRYRMIGIQSDPIGTGFNGDDSTAAEGVNAFWPKINGKNICMYKINNSESSSLFAVSANLNGRDCDLIISVSERYPDGKILGTRYEDSYVIQKGLNKLIDGDIIAFYYPVRSFGENESSEEWQLGEEFTITEELSLEWAELDSDDLSYCLLLTDIRNDASFTDLQVVE